MRETGKLNKISDNDLRKELTELKQTGEYKWLYEVSNNVAKQAVKDVCNAIARFHCESKKHGYRYRQSAIKSGKELNFTDFEDFPRFKSKRKSKISFYHDTEKLKVYSDNVHLEKIGKVELAEKGRIPTGTKYTNPRITHDGKYWYISVGVEQETELTGETNRFRHKRTRYSIKYKRTNSKHQQDKRSKATKKETKTKTKANIKKV